MKKIFIIGGGIAALEAAKSARSTQRDALIVLISAENFLPYSRPMLTKQLMGKVTAQDLAVKSAAWYDEKDIVVLTGRTVTAIDPVGKTLVAGGTPFHWDSLILATGASCFVPPIPARTARTSSPCEPLAMWRACGKSRKRQKTRRLSAAACWGWKRHRPWRKQGCL